MQMLTMNRPLGSINTDRMHLHLHDSHLVAGTIAEVNVEAQCAWALKHQLY